MTRARSAGPHDGYIRFALYVDASKLDAKGVDALIAALLHTAEDYTPAAHIEMPLRLE